MSMERKFSISSEPIQKVLERPQVPLMKFGKEVSLQRGSLKRPALEECNTVNDNKWQCLDLNILTEILCRVPIEDLFLNVSAVCLSWEAACWDFLFWSRHNILDMSATGVGFDSNNDNVDLSIIATKLYRVRLIGNMGIFGGLYFPERYKQLVRKLMRMLFRIMEGDNICGYFLQSWRCSIQTIILPYDLEIADVHLIYISERTPNLKRLLLLGCCRITYTGFAKAISNWRHLKEIHLGPTSTDDLLEHFIEEIGKSCQGLELLHIHQEGFQISKRNAQLIVNYFPRLKKLVFESGYVFPMGIATLYEMCLQLEEVIFIGCEMVKIWDAREDFKSYIGYGLSCRLYWTVGNLGRAKWKIIPYNYKVEFESKSKFEIELRDREWMESEQREFDWWMMVHVGVPRRLC